MESAAHASPRLTRMAGHTVSRCATSEIRIIAWGLKHVDPEHNPAEGRVPPP